MAVKWAFWREEDDAGDGDEPSAADYVDWLMDCMMKRSLLEVTIRESTPLMRDGGAHLEDFPGTPPGHQSVINRLKVMSGLDPVYLSEPTKTKFEVPRSGAVLVFTIRFDDRRSTPTCKLNLSIRRR
jgi:hypothetical protein